MKEYSRSVRSMIENISQGVRKEPQVRVKGAFRGEVPITGACDEK
jgi:hypothetical protein